MQSRRRGRYYGNRFIVRELNAEEIHMRNEQPYQFEGGTHVGTQTEFYICPPTNVYRSASTVAKVIVNSLEDLTQCPAEPEEEVFALEAEPWE